MKIRVRLGIAAALGLLIAALLVLTLVVLGLPSLVLLAYAELPLDRPQAAVLGHRADERPGRGEQVGAVVEPVVAAWIGAHAPAQAVAGLEGRTATIKRLVRTRIDLRPQPVGART